MENVNKTVSLPIDLDDDPSRHPSLMSPLTPLTLLSSLSPSSPYSPSGTEEHLGRVADLGANEVLRAADRTSEGFSKAADWTLGHHRNHGDGDGRGRLGGGWRIGGRKLQPMHVRVSVRVHRVAFYHPSLDPGGLSECLAAATKPANRESDTVSRIFGVDAEDDVLLERQGLVQRLSEAAGEEAMRLSRDGIATQYYALRHADPPPAPGGSPSPRHDSFGSVPSRESLAAAEDLAEAAAYLEKRKRQAKGYRRIVMDSSGGGGQPFAGEFERASVASSSLSKVDLSSDDDAASTSYGGNVHRRDANGDPHAEEYRYVGPPNTGPYFADLLNLALSGSGVTAAGRFLPEVCCRVPSCSVNFEVRKGGYRSPKASKTGASGVTQPFVVEAPHVIWGNARDATLGRIAREKHPLVDAREFEYVSDAKLHETGRSESLLVCGATVWVEKPSEHGTEHDHYHVQDAPKALAQAAKKGVRKFGKGGVGKVSRGFNKVEKKIGKGFKKVGFKGFRKSAPELELTLSSMHLSGPEGGVENAAKPARRKMSRLKLREKLKLHKRRRNPDGMSAPEESIDDSSHCDNGDALSVTSDVSDAVGNRNEMLDASDRSEETDSGIFLHREDRGVNVFEDMQSHVERADKSGGSTGNEEKAEESKKRQNAPEKKQREYFVAKASPYVIVQDDVIDLMVVGFPDREVIAKFPISVTSVVAQRSMEDRINDPLQPTELTTTMIQEPSAVDQKWGVDIKVTVRVVEVHPQIPHVVEEPHLVEKERKVLGNTLFKKGKSAEEIKDALKAKEDEDRLKEREIDAAIVSAGLGKGVDAGASRDEVHQRQMFYDFEQGANAFTVKRRHALVCNRADPLSLKIFGDKKDAVRLLETNFPFVETSVLSREGSKNVPLLPDLSSPKSASQAKNIADNLGATEGDSMKMISLNSLNVLAAKTKPSEPAQGGTFSGEDLGISVITAPGSAARVCLAMAKSFDSCVGFLVGTPTASLVKKLSLSLSPRKNLALVPNFHDSDCSDGDTISKQWCIHFSRKLSSFAEDLEDTNDAMLINDILVCVQSIIMSSVKFDDTDGGAPPAQYRALNVELQQESPALEDSVSSTVADALSGWCKDVSDKLEECAELLGDPADSPTCASRSLLHAVKEERSNGSADFPPNGCDLDKMALEKLQHRGRMQAPPPDYAQRMISTSKGSTVKDALTPFSFTKSAAMSATSVATSMQSCKGYSLRSARVVKNMQLFKGSTLHSNALKSLAVIDEKREGEFTRSLSVNAQKMQSIKLASKSLASTSFGHFYRLLFLVVVFIIVLFAGRRHLPLEWDYSQIDFFSHGQEQRMKVMDSLTQFRPKDIGAYFVPPPSSREETKLTTGFRFIRDGAF